MESSSLSSLQFQRKNVLTKQDPLFQDLPDVFSPPECAFTVAPYSYRTATIGSTRIARRAGR